MISRRNIRTKVVQTIFEIQLQGVDNFNDEANLRLKKAFEKTEALNTFIWHLLISICDYVLVYASNKASKHLPTAYDLNINTKLAENALLLQLKKNNRLSASIKEHKIAGMFDNDIVRTLFLQIVQQRFYELYIFNPERTVLEEKQIIEEIFVEGILNNDVAMSFISEHYINTETDIEMIHSWLERVLLNASGFSFNKLVTKEKYDFSFELLKCYYDKKDFVRSLIEPKLVNWDAERVAQLDLIILHLGICEMLYFESIPLKVTINEYIDIAKSYSGMQSGQFVNGLLDNVRKDLETQNKIHKVDYKLLKK